ncbi:lysin A, protease C39 domain [Gordonia phage Mollymur]|uniref:Lysin A, protease C39 domain n=1 Tax=Gordonia phage Mollymur TaxID=2590895 RepID=A0A4Y6E9P9_9CAUD|nr:endolysin [Gordonia phage Mollymur]QDF15393.1 lysin A, protease C39 domain [Gordonia phage Mollymur]
MADESVVILRHIYHVQRTGYTCGPSALRMVLSTFGLDITEQRLAALCGTTSDGTADINNIIRAAGSYVRDRWLRHGVPNDPPTKAQKDRLWQTCVETVANSRRGMVVNIWAPANNHPPGYPNYLIMHYIAVVGIDLVNRRLYIADSARFGGIEHYWLSLDKLASLIPPKAWMALADPVTPKPPVDPDPFSVFTKEQLALIIAAAHQVGDPHGAAA